MSGCGLKSVTFFNTGRFSYGHIELNGNTLLTGTNGSGKTTTHQSVLFFYGNSHLKSLGISKSDGKLPWVKYMYPNTNSYIFYRYTGLHGDVLLMTYPYSVGTAWRFIEITPSNADFDLASFVLENNVPRIPQDLINSFIVAGFKPTTQIVEKQMYRKILYGDIDYRKEKELAQYRQYALMEAPKDFQHIPEMQSAIFVNSRIGSGAIEKAITSGYGMQFSLSIAQIKGQLKDVMNQFEAVKIYIDHKNDIQKMGGYVKHYRAGTEQVESILMQLMANKIWWENEVKNISISLELSKVEQSEKIEAFKLEISVAEDEYLKIVSDEAEAKVSLKKAVEKLDYYKTFDMDTIVSEVDQIPTLEKEKVQKKSEYDNSLGGAKTITDTYEEILKAEKDGLNTQIRTNAELYNTQKEDLDHQKEAELNRYEKEVLDLEERFETDNAELKSILDQVETKYRDASGEKRAIEVFNPHLNEVNRLKSDISEIKKGIDSAKKESELYIKQINTLAKRREELERNIELTAEDASRRFEVERKPFDNELQMLRAKLEASSESVLGLIRNELPEVEEVLASLLKDEILLSTEINPSIIEIHPSVYGLMFDAEVLPKSEITKESIVSKMTEIRRAIAVLQKRISEETDNRVSVINKEKAEVQKEIYSLKTKKEGADDFIANNSSKLFSLEDDLLVMEGNAITKWTEDKAKASRYYEDIKKEYESLQHQNNEAVSKLKESKAYIKREHIQKITTINGMIQALRIELKEKNDVANAKSSESVKEIETRRDEALTNGGYSPDKINEFKNALERANCRHLEALNNSGLVSSWRKDKPDIDNIPSMRTKHDTLLKFAETISERNKKRTSEIDVEKSKIESAIIAMGKKIDNYDMYIADAESVLSSYEFEYLVKKIRNQEDGVPLPSYTEEPASALKNNVNIAKNKSDEYGRMALSSLQKFLGYISDRERFVFFGCDISSSERAVRSIENLVEFVESGGLDQIKETIASEIRLIQGNFSVQHESFNSETKSIEMLVQRIDKGLKRAIEKIPVIDELGIRIIKNEHRIFRDLEAIASVDIPYGDTKSLFADLTKSSKSSTEILEHFTNLLSHLEDEKSEELSIADIIEVQFKITENGNTSDWSGSKGNIGSAGTSIIVKTLTYIALLNAVIELTQRGDRVPVHVMLDEIGTIDQHNMRQVIDFANENGILFLNAAPDIKIPDRYKNMYLYRLSGGKTKVACLAVRS